MKRGAATRPGIRRRAAPSRFFMRQARARPGRRGRPDMFQRPPEASPPIPRLASPFRVTVGGKPAQIVYAGAAPHAVSGLLQVNFRVPANAPVGDAIPLVLTVGDVSSPEGVTMAVRSAAQRMLVTDSDPAIRSWFRRVLAGAGYEVFTAKNDEEALARASGNPMDHLAAREQERVETLRLMQE